VCQSLVTRRVVQVCKSSLQYIDLSARNLVTCTFLYIDLSARNLVTCTFLYIDLSARILVTCTAPSNERDIIYRYADM